MGGVKWVAREEGEEAAFFPIPLPRQQHPPTPHLLHLHQKAYARVPSGGKNPRRMASKTSPVPLLLYQATEKSLYFSPAVPAGMLGMDADTRRKRKAALKS